MLSKARTQNARIHAGKEFSKHNCTDIKPTDVDVLCGRGRTNFHHEGNKRFRDIVGRNLQTYLSADSRSKKTIIVHSITDEIINGGTRFLKQDSKTLQWFEAGVLVAREKVGHALRDANSDKSRAIKNIHLDHLKRKTSSNNKKNTKKRRTSSTKISALDAHKLTLLDAARPDEPITERAASMDAANDAVLHLAYHHDEDCAAESVLSLPTGHQIHSVDEFLHSPDGTEKLRSFEVGLISRPPHMMNHTFRVSSWESCHLGSIDNSCDQESNAAVVVHSQEGGDLECSVAADSIFSDDFLRDLITLSCRSNPSPSGSLDDYLDAVSEIELDDLEAYLSHALA